MFSGFSHVMLYVNDIDRATKWYQEKLDFKADFASPHYASLQLQEIGFRLDLHPTGVDSNEVGYGAITYFKVKNINEAVAKLKGKDIRVGEPKTEGGSTFATFWDSEGNALGLLEV
jgi:predicted enzyme related to lactoylglutathione lyase